MSVQRIVGIDFGTSTSVIRVKRYENGRPTGDAAGTMSVEFDMGKTMVPTLIRKSDNGENVYFGYDAVGSRRNTRLYQNFKLDLESTDYGVKRQAQELTGEYIRYLAKEYKNQSDGGHLGAGTDDVKTLVSYPVKWSNETRDFMLQTAREAGFPNVEGMNEAQAAIRAVTVQSADYLSRQGYFKPGVPVNILLLDMGAGTTDLILCRHTPGLQPQTEVLCTWPKRGDMFFSGRQMDELLRTFITLSLSEQDAEAVLSRLKIEQYREWKEKYVSPALKRKETVDNFEALDNIAEVLDMDPEFSLNRDALESTAEEYLRTLPIMVYDCLHEAKLDGGAIDLVILTGGHSQWYFVPEMLSGKLEKFGQTGLTKLQKDPGRIIPVSRPQETVALGLVYSGLRAQESHPEQKQERGGNEENEHSAQRVSYVSPTSPTCIKDGRKGYWQRENDTAFYEDKECTKRLHLQDVYIRPLGHDFQWKTEGDFRVQICRRCGYAGQRQPIIFSDPAPEPNTAKTTSGYSPESCFDVSRSGADSCIITRYIGPRNVKVVSIPPEIQGRKVAAIGKNAFTFPTGIKYPVVKIEQIVIPKTVTAIDEEAFFCLTSLRDVTAHSGIESIGDRAFATGSKLRTVDFGEGCPGKGVVRFPKGLKIIGHQAFYHFASMRSSIKEADVSHNTKLYGINENGGKIPFSSKRSLHCIVYYYD